MSYRMILITAVTGAVIALNVASARANTADFNGDALVDGQDFVIWNGNKFTSGGFAQGDANGDGYVGILGDLNEIMCQWTPGPNPAATATASATFAGGPSPTASVTINNPGFLGLDGLYLVNENGAITEVGIPLGPAETGNPNTGFAAPSASLNYTGVGVGGPTTATFALAATTALSDLQFYYQRFGEPPVPITITDGLGGSHTPGFPSTWCCVPEPNAMVVFLGSLAGLLGLLRR